jgi:hypothetical protein
MRKDALQKDLLTPDLATIKDFFRFYIVASCGRIVAKPTVDSINTSAEWFLAGFTRITGTEINEEDRIDSYNLIITRFNAEPTVRECIDTSQSLFVTLLVGRVRPLQPTLCGGVLRGNRSIEILSSQL